MQSLHLFPFCFATKHCERHGEMLSSMMSFSSNRLISFSMKLLSSLEYFYEGILIGSVFLSIPGNSRWNSTLLHITYRLLSFSCLKFNGLCFPSKSNVIDWCCLSTFSPIITSFTKLFSRVNSTFLHRNFSFP